MKRINILVAFAMLMFSTQAQALLIEADVTTSLVPGVTCVAGDTVCETAILGNDTSSINEYLERDFGIRLYKSDFGGIDSGAFASSYDTLFTELDGDGEPSGAEITLNDGATPILCPSCYLLVKDGEKADPAWYLYDLGDWDGLEIILTGFWDGDRVHGAISHVAIYGGDHNIPEPGILALLGTGLTGVFLTRRKVK